MWSETRSSWMAESATRGEDEQVRHPRARGNDESLRRKPLRYFPAATISISWVVFASIVS